ncbi:MAG TPA: hypothetical protein VFQ75_01960 [Candidatus Limnocylindrales bacterium]|jgi:hypothetical protein|nr:hypothetical protein [Candidatus Limnocylindrales bacterium]
MKRRFRLTLRVLIVLNILVVALLAGTMVADWMRILPTFGGATPSAEPSPLASIQTMQMGLAHIPTSNSCLLCHTEGGEAGLKPVPALGHPVEGWTACLTCHTNEKLGRTAPGHDGIAETECLNCHKEAKAGPAITQAHAELNQPCLDCHGTVAHLPASMVGRNQDECWLCHKPNPSPPPIKPHPDPRDLSCRECHQSADVGGLPIDHALRGDDTCVLCHDVRPKLQTGAPTAAPSASGDGT